MEVVESLRGKNVDPSFGIRTLPEALGGRVELPALQNGGSLEVGRLGQMNPLTKYRLHGMQAVMDSLNYEEQRLRTRVYP